MGWLQDQRAAQTKERLRINAIKRALAEAGIPLNSRGNGRGLDDEQLASIDFNSLESLLSNNLLQPIDSFERRSVEIEFSIYRHGQIVSARCWVPSIVDNADEASKYQHDLGNDKAGLDIFQEVIRKGFSGAIEIKCVCMTLDDIPSAIMQINRAINLLVEFVGD
jgi:hypothetical protein